MERTQRGSYVKRAQGNELQGDELYEIKQELITTLSGDEEVDFIKGFFELSPDGGYQIGLDELEAAIEQMDDHDREIMTPLHENLRERIYASGRGSIEVMIG